MKNYKIVADTTKMTHEDWLNIRQYSVGGSEIAAVCGLSRWKSPFEVWCEKVAPDQIKKAPATAAMTFGTLLEPVIRDYFRKENRLEVSEAKFIFAHKDYKYMTANIDGYVKLADGKYAVLEIKTANSFASDEWSTNGLPIEYYCQVQYYMAITGMTQAYVAVLIGGQDYRQLLIDKDDEIIDLIMKRCQDFWENYVLTKTPPTVTDKDNALLSQLYPNSKPQTIMLGKEVEELLAEHEAAKAAMDEAKKRKEAVEAKLKALMGEAEAAVAGEYKISWKASTRSSFSSDKAKELLTIEQIQACTVSSTVRTMRITKSKPKTTKK